MGAGGGESLVKGAYAKPAEAHRSRGVSAEVSEIWAGTNGRSTPEKRKQGKARNPGAVFRGEAHSREGPVPDLGSPPWREITGKRQLGSLS